MRCLSLGTVKDASELQQQDSYTKEFLQTRQSSQLNSVKAAKTRKSIMTCHNRSLSISLSRTHTHTHKHHHHHHATDKQPLTDAADSQLRRFTISTSAVVFAHDESSTATETIRELSNLPITEQSAGQTVRRTNGRCFVPPCAGRGI